MSHYAYKPLIVKPKKDQINAGSFHDWMKRYQYSTSYDHMLSDVMR